MMKKVEEILQKAADWDQGPKMQQFRKDAYKMGFKLFMDAMLIFVIFCIVGAIIGVL